MNDRSGPPVVDAEALDWDKGSGLLPAIVQDADSLRVLMLGYMDQAALAATRDTGLVTFFSRSKGRLWTKGERSGHVLELVSIQADCDADTLLVLAHPRGPTCHLDRPSCFADAPAAGTPANANEAGLPAASASPAAPAAGAVLVRLDTLIATREQSRPEGSYTTRLFEAGVRRIAQKVGEEGVETALAAVAEDDAALVGEAADLAYHLLVLLRARGLGLADVERILAERRH